MESGRFRRRAPLERADPGEQLVTAAARGGFAVEVVPGPSAPAAALFLPNSFRSQAASATTPAMLTAPTYHLSLAGISAPSSPGGAPGPAQTSVPRASPLGVRIMARSD